MGSKFDFRMSRSDYDDLCFDLTDDEHAVLDLRRRGQHYVRGHYSRDDGRDSLIERMEDIMRGADSKDRESIQRCIDMMRNS